MDAPTTRLPRLGSSRRGPAVPPPIPAHPARSSRRKAEVKTPPRVRTQGAATSLPRASRPRRPAPRKTRSVPPPIPTTKPRSKPQLTSIPGLRNAQRQRAKALVRKSTREAFDRHARHQHQYLPTVQTSTLSTGCNPIWLTVTTTLFTVIATTMLTIAAAGGYGMAGSHLAAMVLLLCGTFGSLLAFGTAWLTRLLHVASGAVTTCIVVAAGLMGYVAGWFARLAIPGGLSEATLTELVSHPWLVAQAINENLAALSSIITPTATWGWVAEATLVAISVGVATRWAISQRPQLVATTRLPLRQRSGRNLFGVAPTAQKQYTRSTPR